MSFSIVLSALLAVGQGPASDAVQAFARMRTLQGTWKGTFYWTGSRTDSGEMIATYHLTGNGTTLLEDLSTGGDPAMTSAYHLDKNDLRMTHYCGVGNQPRLKASSIDLAKNLIRFEFVDITNLPTAEAPHVHGFAMRMVDADHLELQFAFQDHDKESLEHIALTRVAAK